MRCIWRLTVLGFIVLALVLSPDTSSAQFGKLKKKVTDKVEKKAEEEVDEKIDETLEGKEEQAEEQAGAEEEPAGETGATSATNATAANKMKPGEGAWANYDFVPGDRVIYFEDFEKCPVGDFPQRLEFESGNMETIEWEGGKYLRMPTHADYNIPLPEILPDRFTVEFDLYLAGGVFKLYCQAPDRSTASRQSYIELRSGGGVGIHGGGGGESNVDLGRDVFKEFAQIRIMGYGKYLKLYVNDQRVANVPNANFNRADKIHINLYNFSQDKNLIDNIRVAEGGKKILYEALMADGRVATRGIYFDSGSDRLRPESTPTLKQIGTMLREHADLGLMIEGHTDDEGEDDYNMELSDRRAAAVKAFLVDAYAIDPSRLQTKGFGETKPAAPNNTPEGKQNNRRVELVKL